MSTESFIFSLANKTARGFIASDFVLQVRKHNQLQDLEAFGPRMCTKPARPAEESSAATINNVQCDHSDKRLDPFICTHPYGTQIHIYIYILQRVTSGSRGLKRWTLSCVADALLTQLYFSPICLDCLLAGARCPLVYRAAVSQSKLTLCLCVRACVRARKEAHTRPKLM